MIAAQRNIWRLAAPFHNYIVVRIDIASKLMFPEAVSGDTLKRRRSTEKEAKMGILTWIIVGLIAGALAKLIMPGDDPGGILVTIIIGIVGAFIGGFVFNLLGSSGVTGFNIWSLIVATIGAIILLAIYRAVVGSRAAR
jgi:uncharacterized membrane protein YeaQ/YmgE (transglycosylase-associated protein family)